MDAHFKINSTESAINIFNILIEDKNIPVLEALDLIESRIMLAEEDVDRTIFKCTKCYKVFITDEIDLPEACRESLDWFNRHRCGKVINLRK